MADLAKHIGTRADQLAVEHVVADLDADDNWDLAAAGVRFVLHVAAPMPATLGSDTESARIAPRLQMARLVDSFRAGGVDKVVHVSSIAAVWYGKDDCAKIFDETDWTDIEHPANNPYTISKTVAERAGWELVGKPDSLLRWTAVNPVFVLGQPIGRAKGAANEIIDLLIGGKLPGVPRLGYSIVDVRDVVDLLLSAMVSRACDGQRLVASTGYVSVADMVAEIRREFPDLAPHLPTKAMGDSVIRMAARVSPLLRNEIINLGIERRASSVKAHELLNWKPRDTTETILDTVRYLLERNE